MDKELEFIVDNTPLAAFVINRQGEIISCNKKMASLLGIHCRSHKLSINFCFDKQSSQYIKHLIGNNESTENNKPFSSVLRHIQKQKNICVELNWKQIKTHSGTYWFFVVYNVDRFKKEIANLKYQATKDELTGINNRWNFFNKFDEEIKKARRYDHSMSLLLIDIDYFKKINDSYGHHIGDRYLKTFAHKIEPLLRESDVFARLGGDEFAILMPETDLNQATNVASRINSTLRQSSIMINKQKIYLSGSIGVAAMIGKDISRSTLLELSDAALYKAKYGGRNRVEAEKLCVA